MTPNPASGSLRFVVETAEDLQALSGLDLPAILAESADTLAATDMAIFLAPRDRLFTVAKLAERHRGRLAQIGVAEIPNGRETVSKAVQNGATAEDFILAGEQGVSARSRGEDILAYSASAPPLCDTVELGDTGADSATLGTRGPSLILTNLAGVEPLPVEWVWPGRIPAGMLTVIGGDPGGGKSTFSAYVAACITTGRPWIDDRGADPGVPGRVLFLTAEDDTARVLVPRLIAAEADLSMVEVIDGVRLTPNGHPSHLELDRDLDLLHAAVAKRPDIRLVVIDPITAYYGKAARDSHNTAVMRGMLSPVKMFCETTGCAVLAITHLNKAGGGTSATRRITGSLALPAAARAVYLLDRDPEQPDRRLLLIDKMNVGREPSGLAFHLAEGNPPRVEWEPEPVSMTARDLLGSSGEGIGGPNPAVEEAMEFLRHRLGNHAVPGQTVTEDARRAAISKRALDEACGRLKIIKGPSDFGGPWVWRIPESSRLPQSGTDSQSHPSASGGAA